MMLQDCERTPNGPGSVSTHFHHPVNLSFTMMKHIPHSQFSREPAHEPSKSLCIMGVQPSLDV